MFTNSTQQRIHASAFSLRASPHLLPQSSSKRHDGSIEVGFTEDTTYCKDTAYDDTLFVTAVYKNPSGESGPSNLVISEGLPVSIKKDSITEKKSIDLYIFSGRPGIDDNHGIESIKVYSINGVRIMDSRSQRIEATHLHRGIYIVNIIGRNCSNIGRKLIMK